MQHVGGPKRQTDDPEADRRAEQRRRFQLSTMTLRKLRAVHRAACKAAGQTPPAVRPDRAQLVNELMMLESV